MQRVFPDGGGSYDQIDKGIDLWIKQFGGSTKVTFASDDLPLLKDSIITLWNRGIREVNANVVFEDVWKEGDDKIFEDQLIQLADYIIDHELFRETLYCSLFDDTIGTPYRKEEFNQTYCGAGKMLSLSSDGGLYPCLRYYGHSLNNHPEWPIGSLEDGFDMERIRPFMLATVRVQSDEECLGCDIASGCGFCQGFNYDEADTPTNFHRAKYICKMHKARVRANDYYFARLFNRYGIRRRALSQRRKMLYILLADDYVPYCMETGSSQSRSAMSQEMVLQSLRFARDHFFRPVLVHPRDQFDFVNLPDYEGYEIMHIVPAQFLEKAEQAGLRDVLPVFTSDSVDLPGEPVDNCMLNIAQGELSRLADCVKVLLKRAKRINLNITDIDHRFDEILYREQLAEIKEYLLQLLREQGALKEVSLLTDRCFIQKHDNCQAGENTFALGRNGAIYTCAALYSRDPDGSSIGNVKDGITKKYDARLYQLKNNNLCVLCDAYQCKNCVVLNRDTTNEVNVSPSFQCRKSHIERAVSADLMSELKKDEKFGPLLQELDVPEVAYLDPIQRFLEEICEDRGDTGRAHGYYTYKK